MFRVWAEVVCADCSVFGVGGWTAERIRRSEMKKELRQKGWELFDKDWC